jgi:hypothetical protein
LLHVTDVSATTVSLSWLSPRDGILPESYVVSYTDVESGRTVEDLGVPHRYGLQAFTRKRCVCVCLMYVCMLVRPLGIRVGPTV